MTCNHQFQVVCDHRSKISLEPCSCVEYTKTLIRVPHYLIHCINCNKLEIITPMPNGVILPPFTALLPEDFTPYSTKLTGIFGILVPVYIN